jgi:hypothetical protein
MKPFVNVSNALPSCTAPAIAEPLSADSPPAPPDVLSAAASPAGAFAATRFPNPLVSMLNGDAFGLSPPADGPEDAPSDDGNRNPRAHWENPDPALALAAPSSPAFGEPPRGNENDLWFTFGEPPAGVC